LKVNSFLKFLHNLYNRKQFSPHFPGTALEVIWGKAARLRRTLRQAAHRQARDNPSQQKMSYALVASGCVLLHQGGHMRVTWVFCGTKKDGCGFSQPLLPWFLFL